VDRVWQSHSERAGLFHSMATCNWVMVVTRHRGRIFLTIRGPETKATGADCPAEGEWVGIHFKLGSFMPLIPPASISNRNDLTLSGSSRSFWLDGSTWEYPNFENADVFVNRLVKKGLVETDPLVVAALNGQAGGRSLRTEQRHFVRATGMTHATIQQIERARHATALLRSGNPIGDVAFGLGYFDQAHLTRSLKHFVGQTPAQIARKEEQLSLLYNRK
jgi:AraC-like DNA-binding protein